MEKVYDYENERFIVKQDPSECEYAVKHSKWEESTLTVYLTSQSNQNAHRWAAKGSSVSIGTDGSFQATLDACCKHIISAHAKGPTFQERCQEGAEAFKNL